MAETLIEAERIVPGNLTTIAPGHVLVRDGVIAAVGEGPPPRRPDVRLDSGVLVPGFVDLQVNGYFGAELEAVRPDEWRMIAARLPETGTTAFMPTFLTAPVAQLASALRRAGPLAREQAQRAGQAERAGTPSRPGRAGSAEYAGRPGQYAGQSGRVRGARVLGVHLEGPFISPLRAGAHNKDWMTDPAPGAISELRRRLPRSPEDRHPGPGTARRPGRHHPAGRGERPGQRRPHGRARQPGGGGRRRRGADGDAPVQCPAPAAP